MKNKIGWCSMTWNPCWGCRNRGCPYCYARRIASFRYNRMADKEYSYMKSQGITIFQGEIANRLRHFVPTFIESNFYKKLPKKPQRIFVGSMSEIAHWKRKWIVDVIHKIEQYPQHTFQFLTRYPEIYLKYAFPQNCWLGMTVADTETYNYLEYQKFKISNPDNLKFISFEPLLYKVSINLEDIDWVIIGAETGNRKGKIVPKREWIEYIIGCCRYDRNIPVYLKDSLKEIYPEGIKEFPKKGE